MRLGVRAAIVEGALVPGDLEIVEGRVTAFGLAARGRGLAVPGFVDLQVNGFGGVDFLGADADGYRRAGEALLETGVVAFQPTLVTAPEEALVAALRELPERAAGARVIGAHLEGPFLAPSRMGAHLRGARRDPDPALLERLLRAGPVTQVTLAPELPGALELIDLLHGRGVVVSLGHSNATAEQANAAFARGVRTVTHLFNAMRPFGHRDPGIAGAALADPSVVVQVILDGHHLAPETAAVVWQAARGRVALVTDAIASTRMGDGQFPLGPVEVQVRDGVARTTDGALGGSVLTMGAAVRSLHALGATLEEAVAAATSVPARVADRPELGVLEPGGSADLVVLDDRLELERVLVEGSERVVARA